MTMTPPPGPIPPKAPTRSARRSWLERHWPWLVPVGCFTFVMLIVILNVALFGGIAFLVLRAAKSSTVYREAVARAQAHPRVRELLGTPIKPGFFIWGSVQLENGSGFAEFEVPISGPRGSGKIFVRATKSEHEWKFQSLKVRVRRPRVTIDLLDAETTAPDLPKDITRAAELPPSPALSYSCTSAAEPPAASHAPQT